LGWKNVLFPLNAMLDWITGWSYFDELHALKGQVNKVGVNNLASSLGVLRKVRLDLAVGPIRDISPLISRFGFGGA